MNDPEIRKLLIPSLVKQFPEGRIIQELTVDSTWGESTINDTAIADVVVVSDLLHCYEIKSDKDTLARLPRQMKQYNRVFDTVTLVVGERLFPDAVLSQGVPWGCGLGLCAFGKMRVIREPKRVYYKDWPVFARLLWRCESLEILERYGFAKGFKGKTKDVLAARIVEKLTPEEIHKEVLETLKERDYYNPKHTRTIEVIDCSTIRNTATPAITSTRNASDTSGDGNNCSATSGA